MYKERITERQKVRAEIASNKYGDWSGHVLLLMSESLDDYIEHKIESNEVLVGILRDIQGNTAEIAEEYFRVQTRNLK